MKTDEESITTNPMANVSTNPMATGGTVSAPVHGGAPVTADELADIRKSLEEIIDEHETLRAWLNLINTELDKSRGENK